MTVASRSAGYQDKNDRLGCLAISRGSTKERGAFTAGMARRAATIDRVASSCARHSAHDALCRSKKFCSSADTRLSR